MTRPDIPIQLCCNPNNPYDWIGQLHNYQIWYVHVNYYDEIMSIEDQNERQARIKELINETAELFLNATVDLDVLDNVYGNPGLYSEIDFSTYADIFNHMDNLSQQDRATLISFYDLLIPLPLDNYLDGMKALIAATEFENDFLSNNNNINNLNVLGAIAVTKYSICTVFTQPDPHPAMKIKWWHVLADAVGGVIGGIAGGVVGALEGAAAGTEIYDLCTSN